MKVCLIDGCCNPVVARKMCHKHYKRWQVHGDPTVTLKPTDRVCSIEGCFKKHSSLGYCATHERRFRRYGTTNRILNNYSSLEVAYNDQVIKNNIGCWGWKGSVGTFGYAILCAEGKNTAAHRFSYLMNFDDFDSKMFVLHKCDNPICSKPTHLFLGTQKDNIQDCIKKGRFKKVEARFKARGERVSGCRLIEAQVMEIKKMIEEGYKNTEIASIFGVAHQTISCIKLRKTWKHIQ